MEYKNFTGSVEFSEDDNLFFGKVLGIRALLSYEGSTLGDLEQAFRRVVDDYIAFSQNQTVD